MAITYQSQENVIDVTASPYFAKGDGTTDDTAAIQQAVSDGVLSKRLVFFPSGKTYLAKGQIFAHLPGTTTWSAWLKIQGGDQATTIIKLADNQVGFQSSDTAKALIVFGSDNSVSDGSGNDAFANYIFDITIDIGSGNPKAQGVDWIVSNYGTMENVTIRSSDSGKVGDTCLSMSRTGKSGYGPGYIKNCTFDGCNYGITIVGTEYSETWENVSVENQLVAGAKITGNIVTALNFQSNNKVRAFDIYDQAYLVLLYSQLNGVAGYTQTQNAITTHSNNAQVYLYNVTSSNYQNLLVETQYSNRTLVGGNVSEYSSVGISVLHNTVTDDKWGGNLPFLGSGQPAPEAPVYDPSQFFYFPQPSNQYDEIWGHWQDAIASGKPAWAFPTGVNFNFYTQGSLVIPSSLKYLKGNYASIAVPQSSNKYFADANNPKSMFLIQSGSDQLFIEKFFPILNVTDTLYFDNEGGDFLTNSSNRDIVISHVCAGGGRLINNAPSSGNIGKLWVTDYSGNLQLNVPGQQVWCRQLNTEGNPANITKIVSNGAKLWILGLKTENASPILDSSNNAKTQILGGLIYPAASVDSSTIMLKNTESSLTAVLAGSNYNSTANQYSTLVQETRSSDVKTLAASSVPNRSYSSFFLAYNGIQPKDKYMTKFSYGLELDQSISANTFVSVNFNAPYEDSDSQLSNGIFTCKVPGDYSFNGTLFIETPSTGTYLVTQFKKTIASSNNSEQAWRGFQIANTSAGQYSLPSVDFINMQVGDTLSMQIYSSSGGTLKTLQSYPGNILNRFAGFLVNPA